MNYTYLAPHTRPSTTSATPDPILPSGPMIIMTSNPSSKKTLNLLANPTVSLLVHDWVSARPPHVSSSDGRDRSPLGTRSSSLATMLMQMNSAAVSSISATMNGEARVLAPGTAEERWCREQHLANNTFEEQAGGGGGGDVLSRSVSGGVPGDGGRGSYIEDEDVRVVVVRITGGRISDWKGGVKDWVIRDAEAGREGLVNGVPAD